jgi:8-oxo-dGTP pyrophosphatase MutT (NUDIX family)
MARYDHIDFRPPKGAQESAARGLELRAQHGRGGDEEGVARAGDLSNGRALSPETSGRQMQAADEEAAQRMGRGASMGAPLGKSQRVKDLVGIASVAAFDPAGRLLFGKRRDSGKWTLPGGHLQLGESPEAGARRELFEEAALSPAALSFLGSGQSGNHVIYAYRADGIADPPSGANDPDEEIAEFAWVDVTHGLPPRIAEALHAPKNVTLHLLELLPADGLAMISSARAAMQREFAPPPVGVWDAVCTFGSYQHETVNGTPCVTVHDASTCKVMLDDFAAHPECDIFYDKKHEVVDELGEDTLDRDKMRAWGEGDGHALAWANALVMILGGQVVRYEPHPGAPATPPTAEEVLRQSDGTLRPDGVYCRRSQITPRGADPVGGLSVFRYTSPFFVPEKDGNRLLNLTVTNDPRMRDCALAFSRDRRVAMQRVQCAQNARTAQRSSALEKAPMAKKMEDQKGAEASEHAAVMAAAGCTEGDSPEVKLEKMAAYARKLEEEAQKAAEARKQDEARRVEEARKAGRQMDAEPFAGKETPAEEAAEHDELLKRIDLLEEKNAMLAKELEESRGAMKRFEAMEDKAKEHEAQAFARTALAMGRIRGDHKGSVEQTENWLADRYRKNPADAEDLLCAEGTFQVSERIAMRRYTQNGTGIGAPMPRADVSPADEVDALVAKEIKALQAENQKGDLTALAMSRVSKKHPAAWQRYVNRNRG